MITATSYQACHSWVPRVSLDLKVFINTPHFQCLHARLTSECLVSLPGSVLLNQQFIFLYASFLLTALVHSKFHVTWVPGNVAKHWNSFLDPSVQLPSSPGSVVSLLLLSAIPIVHIKDSEASRSSSPTWGWACRRSTRCLCSRSV